MTCCESFTISRMIGFTIKLSTFIGIILIILDIMILFRVFEIDNVAMIVKNTLSIVNAIVFSISCSMYIFKFNKDKLDNSVSSLCEYCRNSDLRIKGLEVILATEELGLSNAERFKFRDNIIFRSKLKQCGLILEILFFYFNAIAYGKIYNHQSAENVTLDNEAIYMLNLYISVISPLLSIIFSYITVLCDNVIIVKYFVRVIMENRDKEDYYIAMMKRFVEYPLISVIGCYDDLEDREP